MKKTPVKIKPKYFQQRKKAVLVFAKKFQKNSFGVFKGRQKVLSLDFELQPEFGRAVIQNIYFLKEEFAGKGFASSLLQDFVKHCRKKGLKFIQAEVLTVNGARLFERNGFQRMSGGRYYLELK